MAVPDANALQLAPDALPEEEEPVLLERGLRDIEECPEQLDHVRAHQPAQEPGQDGLAQTVLGGRDAASPWEERGRRSPHMLPEWPLGPGRLHVRPTCHDSAPRAEENAGISATTLPPLHVKVMMLDHWALIKNVFKLVSPFLFYLLTGAMENLKCM